MPQVLVPRLCQGTAGTDVPGAIRTIPSEGTADADTLLGWVKAKVPTPALPPRPADASSLVCIWIGSPENQSAVVSSLDYMFAFQFG